MVVPRCTCDVQLSLRRGCWLHIIPCGECIYKHVFSIQTVRTFRSVTKVSAIYDFSRKKMHPRSVYGIFLMPPLAAVYFCVWEGNCKTLERSTHPLRKAHRSSACCSLSIRNEHVPTAEFIVCELPALHLMTCWLNNLILRYHGCFTSRKRHQHGATSLCIIIYVTQRTESAFEVRQMMYLFSPSQQKLPYLFCNFILHQKHLDQI